MKKVFSAPALALLPVLVLPVLALAPAAAAQEQDFYNGVDIFDGDPSQAALFVGDDSALSGSVCIGDACSDFEDFDVQTTLKLKSTYLRLEFVDSNNAVSTEPSNDWTLEANDLNAGGLARFSIADATAGTLPFTIEGAAPDSTMWLDNNGRVGLGTMFPQNRLHILGLVGPSIRLEQQGTGLLQPRTWRLFGQNSFGLSDETAGTTPFRIGAAAPDASFVMDASGNIGLGTDTPAAPLEISDDASFSFFRITATGASVNQSADLVFTQGPLGTGEFRYNIVDGDGPEMRLNANGDMLVEGTLTTGGPSCDSGCDAVFDADFDRLSVSDHAALMWEKGHLPAIGPTLPGQPMNLSEKMGGMLNELEHAHIYIDTLHRENAAQEARIDAQSAQIAALTARLDALEGAD